MSYQTELKHLEVHFTHLHLPSYLINLSSFRQKLPLNGIRWEWGGGGGGEGKGKGKGREGVAEAKSF